MAYDKRERGHGRTERRILKVTSVAKGLAFPHAVQAIQIVRRRKLKGKWSRETCYAVTSLTVTQATYAQLAASGPGATLAAPETPDPHQRRRAERCTCPSRKDAGCMQRQN